MENNKVALELLKVFSKLVENRENNFTNHSENVAKITLQMLSIFPHLENQKVLAEYAALLHDIGKIKISENLLNKVGKLEDEQLQELKLHPVFGKEIFSSFYKYSNFFEFLSNVIESHHIRCVDFKFNSNDGPDSEIVYVISQMIALSEAYDVMLHKRIGEIGKSKEEINEELKRHTGSQFDAKLTLVFTRLFCS